MKNLFSFISYLVVETSGPKLSSTAMIFKIPDFQGYYW